MVGQGEIEAEISAKVEQMPPLSIIPGREKAAE